MFAKHLKILLEKHMDVTEMKPGIIKLTAHFSVKGMTFLSTEIVHQAGFTFYPPTLNWYI